MAKKKKKRHPHIDKSPVRKRRAKGWLKSYTGTAIVKDYRAHFKGVDVACAVRELREVGYEFQFEWLTALDFEIGYVQSSYFVSCSSSDDPYEQKNDYTNEYEQNDHANELVFGQLERVFSPLVRHATIQYGYADIIKDNDGPLFAYIRFPIAGTFADRQISAGN